METYRHHVSGFFASRNDAESAFATLVAGGLPREQVRIYANDAAPPTAAQAESNTVLKDVLVDGAIGTAVGTGIGALAEVALVAANVTLFVASPLIAPLAMLGWGASLGGVVGAVAGTMTGAGNKPGTKESKLSALIGDAISSGQVVLVAETRSEQETTRARDVIKAAVGAFEDVGMAA